MLPVELSDGGGSLQRGGSPQSPDPRRAPEDGTDLVASYTTPLTEHAGIQVPLICGAMYPCSNPELVAAASNGGGLGVLQPLSLTRVHGYDFREGLRFIRRMTGNPVGMNVLIEKSSRRYMDRMFWYVDIALEEGIRFFVTSLGNPRWVVERVTPHGGVVYHDVTERKWALKGLDSGVHGLIAVNRRAGGHPGPGRIEELIEELGGLGVPVVCAGGIGTPAGFARALALGYAGAQLGTRFIATRECTASKAYKQAIVNAQENDVLLSERLTGLPVAVLNTPYIRRMGLKAGPLAKHLLGNRRTKYWMRTFYGFMARRRLKRSLTDGEREIWQAGKSVGGIESVESATAVVREYAAAVG